MFSINSRWHAICGSRLLPVAFEVDGMSRLDLTHDRPAVLEDRRGNLSACFSLKQKEAAWSPISLP